MWLHHKNSDSANLERPHTPALSPKMLLARCNLGTGRGRALSRVKVNSKPKHTPLSPSWAA